MVQGSKYGQGVAGGLPTSTSSLGHTAPTFGPYTCTSSAVLLLATMYWASYFPLCSSCLEAGSTSRTACRFFNGRPDSIHRTLISPAKISAAGVARVGSVSPTRVRHGRRFSTIFLAAAMSSTSAIASVSLTHCERGDLARVSPAALGAT